MVLYDHSYDDDHWNDDTGVYDDNGEYFQTYFNRSSNNYYIKLLNWF